MGEKYPAGNAMGLFRMVLDDEGDALVFNPSPPIRTFNTFAPCLVGSAVGHLHHGILGKVFVGLT